MSNITPRLGVSINGGFTDHRAEHVHDELYARCLVLDDGNSQIGLVVCDNCLMPGALLDMAKHEAHGHLRITPDRMLISATHTHSAPSVVSVFQSDADLDYAEFLVSRISDGIRRAVNHLAPAKIGWGVGREPSQLNNRRWRMKPGAIPPNPFGRTDQVRMNPPPGSADLVEPAGPTDPDVSLLAVTTVEGRPLAVFANYSLHYVGGVPGSTISADYYGAFAESLARLIGIDATRNDPPFVAIMSNGASGDANNINFRRPAPRQQPYEQMRHVAHSVASEAARVWKQIKFQDHAPLDMSEARLTLGRRLPAADEVARAKTILARARGPQLQTPEEVYANETLQMAEWPKTKETVVQAIRIGGLGIAALPCEVFAETGLAIKAASPLRPTFTISLANDYAGYLPPPAQHRLGGYETWRARSSYLEVEAEPKLRGKAIELLTALARRM